MTSARNKSDGNKTKDMRLKGGVADKGYYLPPPSICHHQSAAVSTSSAPPRHTTTWDSGRADLKKKKNKTKNLKFEGVGWKPCFRQGATSIQRKML